MLQVERDHARSAVDVSCTCASPSVLSDPSLIHSLTRSHARTHARPLRGVMAAIPPLVRVGISLKMLPNNAAVHFKADGARFGQTRTIKLLTGSKYRVEVVVKPGAVKAT